MFELGRLAEEAGDGAAATSWYQQAADLGNAQAIEALERLQ